MSDKIKKFCSGLASLTLALFVVTLVPTEVKSMDDKVDYPDTEEGCAEEMRILVKVNEKFGGLAGTKMGVAQEANTAFRDYVAKWIESGGPGIQDTDRLKHRLNKKNITTLFLSDILSGIIRIMQYSHIGEDKIEEFLVGLRDTFEKYKDTGDWWNR